MTLTKFPEETLIYGFDFADRSEIVGGETLSSGAAVDYTKLVGSGNITVGSPTISGTKVIFMVSGGNLYDRYEFICRVQTSGGSVIAAKGELKIDRI